MLKWLLFRDYTDFCVKLKWHGHLGRVFHGLEARATKFLTSPLFNALSSFRQCHEG